ncbi:MAG: hypothetical protein ICV62_17635 [Cyanobacteria bacterium Co-bin13]|nr:hypothetical protein [Cyanobacteria bacterium Co-bin13]
MFQPSDSGAPASPISADPSTDYEELRHLLYGSLSAISSTINFLHKRGYAEPNDWCEPIPTGRRNEWMSILTKRIPLE